MAKVPNGVKTVPKISVAWVGCTNRQMTDRRQTDGRTSRSRSLRRINVHDGSGLFHSKNVAGEAILSTEIIRKPLVGRGSAPDQVG